MADQATGGVGDPALGGGRAAAAMDHPPLGPHLTGLGGHAAHQIDLVFEGRVTLPGGA